MHMVSFFNSGHMLRICSPQNAISMLRLSVPNAFRLFHSCKRFVPKSSARPTTDQCVLSSLRTLSCSPAMSVPPSKSTVVRGPFAILTDEDLSFFKKLLSNSQIITDDAELKTYNIDWIKNYQGSSKLLLRPRHAGEVSSILSYCNERRLAVCPQGGNTGLVGGSVPVFDEILLSMALMNKVIHLNSISGVLVCEAGCILEALNQFVGDHGLMVPLDLGARGTCHIGGNVATNAGGLKLLRYGNLHGNVLGLETVLADGTIIDCLSTMQKDNTGYDLKQIFVGSEGTLGVITKVAIQCVQKPSSVSLAFLGCASYGDVLATYKEARIRLGEIISAFEMMDQESLCLVEEMLKLRIPIEPVTRFPFYVLMETSGSNQRHDDEKIHEFLEHVLGIGCVADGGLYTQSSQMQSLWNVRESISSASLRCGYCYKYDLSVPIDCLYDIVVDLRRRLGDRVTVCHGFGHIGDCNVHVNVAATQYDGEVHSLLEPYVFEWVSQRGGSISAEHGIGLQKRDYVHLSKSGEALKLMQMLKRQLDPNGIMNPYKVLPRASS